MLYSISSNFVIVKSLCKNNMIGYVYSDFYFYKITSLLGFKLWVNINLGLYFFSLFYKYLDFLFYNFLKIFYFSFIVVGKGFKLVCSKNLIVSFHLGHSHLTSVNLNDSNLLKLTKTRMLMFGLNYLLLRNTLNNLYRFKPLNIFTWRGFKLRKSIKRKKTGKISLYF